MKDIVLCDWKREGIVVKCYRGAASLRFIPIAEADREFKPMQIHAHPAGGT